MGTSNIMELVELEQKRMRPAEAEKKLSGRIAMSGNDDGPLAFQKHALDRMHPLSSRLVHEV